MDSSRNDPLTRISKMARNESLKRVSMHCPQVKYALQNQRLTGTTPISPSRDPSMYDTKADELHEWKENFIARLHATEHELLHVVYVSGKGIHHEHLIRESISELKLSVSDLLNKLSGLVQKLVKRSKANFENTTKYWEGIVLELNAKLEHMTKLKELEEAKRIQAEREVMRLEKKAKMLTIEVVKPDPDEAHLYQQNSTPKQKVAESKSRPDSGSSTPRDRKPASPRPASTVTPRRSTTTTSSKASPSNGSSPSGTKSTSPAQKATKSKKSTDSAPTTPTAPAPKAKEQGKNGKEASKKQVESSPESPPVQQTRPPVEEPTPKPATVVANTEPQPTPEPLIEQTPESTEETEAPVSTDPVPQASVAPSEETPAPDVTPAPVRETSPETSEPTTPTTPMTPMTPTSEAALDSAALKRLELRKRLEMKKAREAEQAAVETSTEPTANAVTETTTTTTTVTTTPSTSQTTEAQSAENKELVSSTEAPAVALTEAEKRKERIAAIRSRGLTSRSESVDSNMDSAVRTPTEKEDSGETTPSSTDGSKVVEEISDAERARRERLEKLRMRLKKTES